MRLPLVFLFFPLVWCPFALPLPVFVLYLVLVTFTCVTLFLTRVNFAINLSVLPQQQQQQQQQPAGQPSQNQISNTPSAFLKQSLSLATVCRGAKFASRLVSKLKMLLSLPLLGSKGKESFQLKRKGKVYFAHATVEVVPYFTDHTPTLLLLPL